MLECTNEFVLLIQSLEGEKRVFIEATGIYHLPVYTYLLEMGISVVTINPLTMYKYANLNISRLTLLNITELTIPSIDKLLENDSQNI